MQSATEHDATKQQPSNFEQAPVTNVFRAPAAEGVAQAPGESQQEAAALGERPYHDARVRAIAAFEHEYLTALLERCAGNVTRCARVAGIDRVYLHRLLRKHDLRGSKPDSSSEEKEQAPNAARRTDPYRPRT